MKGYNLETLIAHVSSVVAIEAAKIFKRGKSRQRVATRSLLCFWAVSELGMSMTALARQLNLSFSGASQSVLRGEKIAAASGYKAFRCETVNVWGVIKPNLLTLQH